MLKKDGTIRSKDSIVYESYKKLQEKKKEVLKKAEQIQKALLSGDFCIETEENNHKEV